MHKKHFDALAAALRTSHASRETCERVAAACSLFNEHFDRARFLRACGLSNVTED